MESGHNDNGYWRKYGDGTLEMWGNTQFQNINCNNKDNWAYYSNAVTVLMPQTSKSLVTPVCTARGANAPWFSIKDTGLSYNSFIGWFYTESSTSNDYIWLSWHCFGTWK